MRVRESSVSAKRFEGCKRALEEAGLGVLKDLDIEVSDYSQESGYLGGKILLTRQDLPTAVVAFSEQLAIGVFKAARESNVKVPEQLSSYRN